MFGALAILDPYPTLYAGGDNLYTSPEGVSVLQNLALPPFTVLTFKLIIPSGVTLGCESSLYPAVRFSSIGIVPGSVCILVNEGRIQGRGGEGGQAVSNTGGNYASGGGGGGAGSPPGVGGIGGDYGGSDGADGTTEVGGLKGTKVVGPVQSAYLAVPTDGTDGLTGLHCADNKTFIINRGEIFGGGGGGAAGGLYNGGLTRKDGGDGGDPGLLGGDAESPAGDNVDFNWYNSSKGQPGPAVEGTDVVWIEGSTSPNVEGSIP